MDGKRVSVAEGKRALTQLLKEAREKQIPILIFNERSNEFVGAILPPEAYEHYQRLKAYFEALHLSTKFAHLPLDLPDVVRASREELEERTG